MNSILSSLSRMLTPTLTLLTLEMDKAFSNVYAIEWLPFGCDTSSSESTETKRFVLIITLQSSVIHPAPSVKPVIEPLCSEKNVATFVRCFRTRGDMDTFSRALSKQVRLLTSLDT